MQTTPGAVHRWEGLYVSKTLSTHRQRTRTTLPVVIQQMEERKPLLVAVLLSTLRDCPAHGDVQGGEGRGERNRAGRLRSNPPHGQYGLRAVQRLEPARAYVAAEARSSNKRVLQGQPVHRLTILLGHLGELTLNSVELSRLLGRPRTSIAAVTGLEEQGSRCAPSAWRQGLAILTH